MKKTGARLVVKDVALSFGGIQALRSVSFEAAPSELIALVGPNGAGKTAMLNCINGIYHPRSGEILLDGERIAGHPLWRMVDLGVGRSFQHAELFPHLTVTENLLIGRHRSFRAGAFMSGLYFGRAKAEEVEARRQYRGHHRLLRDLPVSQHAGRHVVLRRAEERRRSTSACGQPEAAAA